MNSKTVFLVLLFWLSLSNIFSAPPVFFTGDSDPIAQELEKLILNTYEKSFLSTIENPLEWSIYISVEQSGDKIILVINVTTPTVKGRQYDINFEFFSTGNYSSKLSLAALSCIEKMERIYNSLPAILDEIKQEQELLTEIENSSEPDSEAEQMDKTDNFTVPLEETHIIGAHISPNLLFVPSDSANWSGFGIDFLIHYTYDFEDLNIRLGGGLGYFYKHIGSDTDSGDINIQYSGISVVLIEEYFFTDRIYISLKEEFHVILAGDRDINGISENISSGNSLLLQLNGGILFPVAESFVVPLEAGIKIDLGAEDSLPMGFSICSGVQFTL